MAKPAVTIELPSWLDESIQRLDGQALKSDADRIELAIELSAINVKQKTGGPFGALVVEEASGAVVAAGVNLVVDQQLSMAHAEAVAILMAQRKLATFDLAGDAQRGYSLYASGQPCIMCFGILWWSGITRLVYAATADDIQQITGFREGPLPEQWQTKLANRVGSPAIEVVEELHREAACDVLRNYAAAGHAVYNPGSTNDERSS